MFFFALGKMNEACAADEIEMVPKEKVPHQIMSFIYFLQISCMPSPEFSLKIR